MQGCMQARAHASKSACKQEQGAARGMRSKGRACTANARLQHRGGGQEVDHGRGVVRVHQHGKRVAPPAQHCFKLRPGMQTSSDQAPVGSCAAQGACCGMSRGHSGHCARYTWQTKTCMQTRSNSSCEPCSCATLRRGQSARTCAPGCTLPTAQSAGCSPPCASRTTRSRSPAATPAAATGPCAVPDLARSAPLYQPCCILHPAHAIGSRSACGDACKRHQAAGMQGAQHLTRWSQKRLRRVSRRARLRSRLATAAWMLCRSATMCRQPSSAT